MDNTKILEDFAGNTLPTANPTTKLLEDFAGSSDTILPDAVPVTQQFGNYNPEVEKYSGGINNGVDLGVSEGTPVNIPKGNWKVDEASNTGDFNRGYGNSAFMTDDSTGYKIRLSHLKQLMALQQGQDFAGGNIGEVGQTGNTTGPHLDVEVYDPQGQLVDLLKSPFAKYFKVK